MKITKSMIYKPSNESRELYLYTDNDSRLHEMIKAVQENMIRHIERGRYDAEQAIAAFYHITTEAAKRYAKDFGGSFTVTERWTAAQDLRDDFIENYN